MHIISELNSEEIQCYLADLDDKQVFMLPTDEGIIT